MSSAHLVQRAYDAWNRDDFEAARAMVHPDVEWRSSGVFPGLEPVYRGEAGVRDWWQQLREPFERFTVEIERLIEREGRALVVAQVRFRAVGKESGAPVDLQFANVWEFRDGLIVRYRAYASVDEALAAVGG